MGSVNRSMDTGPVWAALISGFAEQFLEHVPVGVPAVVPGLQTALGADATRSFRFARITNEWAGRPALLVGKKALRPARRRPARPKLTPPPRAGGERERSRVSRRRTHAFGDA